MYSDVVYVDVRYVDVDEIFQMSPDVVYVDGNRECGCQMPSDVIDAECAR